MKPKIEELSRETVVKRTKHGTKKAEHLAFTKRKLEALPVPTDRVTYHYDTEVRGLRLAVHPSGRRTFSLYRKFRGRATTYPLGEFPHVAIEQARQQASEKIAAMGRGINPRDELKRPTERTLGAFFARYLREHTRKGQLLTQRQRHDLQVVFDRSLAPWRSRALDEITRADVERLVRQVGQPRIEVIKRKVGGKVLERKRRRGGPVAANRLRSLLSSVFTDARNCGVFASEPPTRGVKKFPEHPRRRMLERGDELARFWAALSNEPDRDLRDYLTLRVLTGVREQNILASRWEDVDVERARWRIGETKNGDPLVVTLAPFVLENVFCARARTGPWVFPGRKANDHLKGVAKPWRAFRQRIGLTDLQPRDLRRTFASRQAAANVPMDVIAQTLGHKPGSKVTASVYALADEDTKRRAVDATVAAMLTEAKTNQK